MISLPPSIVIPGFCKVNEYEKYYNKTVTYHNRKRHDDDHKNLTELCNYCTNTTIRNIEQYYINNPPYSSHLQQIVGHDFENGPEIPSHDCPQNTTNITTSSSSTSDAASYVKPDY